MQGQLLLTLLLRGAGHLAHFHLPLLDSPSTHTHVRVTRDARLPLCGTLNRPFTGPPARSKLSSLVNIFNI